jgi:hypothetical protein
MKDCSTGGRIPAACRTGNKLVQMMPFAHGPTGKKGTRDAVGDTKRILVLVAEAGSDPPSAAEAIAAALQGLHDEQCLVEIVNPLDDARTPGFLRDGQTSQ